jgi:dienelactone hydrolase
MKKISYFLGVILAGIVVSTGGSSITSAQASFSQNIIIPPYDLTPTSLPHPSYPSPLPKKLPGCTPPSETSYSRAWDLSVWLATHTDVKTSLISVTTTQSGQIDPSPFVGTNWPVEIQQFRTAWSKFIGPIPQKDCVALNPQEIDLDLTPDELARVNTSSYQMKHITYRGVHGEKIPAFLLIPNRITSKVPAVIVMHQSLATCGKKEPAGVCLIGTPWLDFAKDFAEKGYVTLAPDSIGYGERSVYYSTYGMEYADAAPLLSRFPSSTLMGLRISDIKRGIDYLQTLSYVDPNRIGMIGHSNGGIETLFSAVFDSRIKCAVSNAGPNLIRRETNTEFGLKPGITRWAGFGYMPALGFYNDDVSKLPIEIHQLYAMIAPRGLFISLMEDDSIAPKFDQVQFAMDQTKRAFDALGGDFAYHTVATGLTPERHSEWAAPMCMSVLYDTCKNSTTTPGCAANFVTAGMTDDCVWRNGSSAGCAHEIWENCLHTPHSEAECQAQFSGIGVTDRCIEESFKTYLRRDHGWYPETENEAYPWLESCLKR